MKARLRAVLVHGLAGEGAWWEPLLSELDSLNIEPRCPRLPSLADRGPEAWVEAVLEEAGAGPAIVVGHSLGAAVAVRAALARPGAFADVALLACPPVFDGFLPAAPEGSGLSATALARVARFLWETARRSVSLSGAVIHFVGDRDPFVPLEQARRLPFPLVSISDADHELNRSPAFLRAFAEHLASSACGVDHLDPAARYRCLARRFSWPAESVTLGDDAPAPARLDVEVTTRCQLACRRCARTLLIPAAGPVDMGWELFGRVLEQAEFARELLFVGLGEPLLHPEIDRMVAAAAERGIVTRLVTNGLLADPARLEVLAAEGLAEVTFSIDAVDPVLFRRLRGGASATRVLDHFRRIPPGLRRSFFVTLSRDNVGELPGLIDLAAEEGLPVLPVTDVNFAENQPCSLHAAHADDALTEALRHARERGVLLLTPRFHDVGEAPRHFRLCVARLPGDISGRAGRHRSCLAPWRIAVVGADGAVTPCNCAPRHALGSLGAEPLAAIWNGPALRRWRAAVRSGSSAPCLSCPRY
ncbi:MAG: radical SAM protein [Deltaproteobacteria bacterium]|nr:radical SAM protein [Deltaproteobacteria bacterium]